MSPEGRRVRPPRQALRAARSARARFGRDVRRVRQRRRRRRRQAAARPPRAARSRSRRPRSPTTSTRRCPTRSTAIEPLWLVYTPLLTYPHVEGEAGAELIPGLAEDLPEISEDGTTYTLTLRDGLKFSDGTDVKASDFEHTIKRVLNLESGGSAVLPDDRGRDRVPREAAIPRATSPGSRPTTRPARSRSR